MRRVLHILTQPDDPLAREMIAHQQARPENEIRVADLTERQPDYKELLEQIFAADSVQSW